jgi:hypothetical protein
MLRELYEESEREAKKLEDQINDENLKSSPTMQL